MGELDSIKSSFFSLRALLSCCSMHLCTSVACIALQSSYENVFIATTCLILHSKRSTTKYYKIWRLNDVDACLLPVEGHLRALLKSQSRKRHFSEVKNVLATNVMFGEYDYDWVLNVSVIELWRAASRGFFTGLVVYLGTRFITVFIIKYLDILFIHSFMKIFILFSFTITQSESEYGISNANVCFLEMYVRSHNLIDRSNSRG